MCAPHSMRRRIVASAGVLALLALTTPSAAWGAGDFGWTIDGSTGFSGLPAPVGPNVSSRADGDLRIEIAGQGTFSPEARTITGGGSYRVLTAAGKRVSYGNWRTTRYLGYEDYGPLLLTPVPYRNGLLKARLLLEGLGRGRIDLLCHAPPDEIDGVRIFLRRGLAFDVIEQGSITIEKQ